LFYCFGLGLPFVATAYGAAALLSVADLVRRHRQVLRWVGGSLLVLTGLALVAGKWNYSADWLRTTLG
jgi:cytochrome c-type biogenesis protein